ncbi:ABC transporter ATP-binding protein [Alkaliphilus hydrothermalis]|uniref:ABC transport system ATP-binding protein n=1 Tax=Alkaliphilus hydrothermalis TaxID=1482730 RepID=A0ABS2NRE3_9FIRM|nr:ABC transporter ATP-binding protein [Alkaliphilus hydrothermalis]MBM7615530.1 putative ABC transport system ATP-binding protein [Alkaliphilus hydrothermalis]
MEALLEFKDVTFGYVDGGKRVEILNDVNVSFAKGIFYTIIGPSGSGKTTTLALASALDVPRKGKIHFLGKDIKKIGYSKHRRENVVLIFQNYNLINYLTAIENVVLGMEVSNSYKGERKKKALKLLNDLGLTEDEAKRNVLKLSGGQQQRVAIARALASNADIILADEPTGNLDQDTAREITTILQELAHKYHKCVIVVSHSQEVADASDIAFHLKNGTLVEV